MTHRQARRTPARALPAVALGVAVLGLAHAPSAGAPPPPGASTAPSARSSLLASHELAPAGLGDRAPVIPRVATFTSSMSTVRWHHAAVPLPDGRVLVAGGYPTDDSRTSAELYDPATGAWTRTAPMLFVHGWPVAAPTCDGRVFVGGNISAAHEAELYDPATDQWTDAGPMKYRHIYGQATLLPDCRILLSGGYDANTRAEVYDPVAGTFQAAGIMSTERFFHTATALADGRVLAVGGGVDANGVWYTYKNVDIWDPATAKWSKVKSLGSARRAHTATLLLDGSVLVAGGTVGGKNDGTEGGTQLDSAEIYDPAADLWTKLGAKLVTPRGLHTAALTPSGSVMLLGGLDATGSASREVEVLHDGVWARLEPLVVDRFYHASATLQDGSVLVAGGEHQATAEIYALGHLGAPCVTGAECAGSVCADGVCCNEPCDGGCRRCDVPGREGTCALPCAGDEHTLACPDGGATCDDFTCVAVPCSPYRCDAAQGACRAACASVADCAPGYACDLAGVCIPPPDISASDEACAIAVPGADPSAAAPFAGWLLAAAAAVFRQRRNTRRARPPTDPGPPGCAAR